MQNKKQLKNKVINIYQCAKGYKDTSESQQEPLSQ